jgi:hypothetical protein
MPLRDEKMTRISISRDGTEGTLEVAVRLVGKGK